MEVPRPSDDAKEADIPVDIHADSWVTITLHSTPPCSGNAVQSSPYTRHLGSVIWVDFQTPMP